ncbi:MAG: hypothetical protein KAT58_11120 [candidate division Zixibacteria bacterium]|nr:hypothetical protein [candidate division Zixibacteria bacterium]
MSFLAGFAAFLDYKYWINTNPVPLGPSLVSGFLVFFCWFLVAASALFVVSRYFRKVDDLKHGIFRRFAHLLFNVGWIGLVILFFAYEQAPILGMRLWFGLLMIYLMARLGMLIIYVIRDYPQRKAAVVERERIKKYLPRTKRK